MSDNSGFNTFSTNRGNYGNRDFMDSNSLVAKFAFLLLVLVAFLFLLRLGISIITWLLSPNNSLLFFHMFCVDYLDGEPLETNL